MNASGGSYVHTTGVIKEKNRVSIQLGAKFYFCFDGVSVYFLLCIYARTMQGLVERYVNSTEETHQAAADHVAKEKQVLVINVIFYIYIPFSRSFKIMCAWRPN